MIRSSPLRRRSRLRSGGPTLRKRRKTRKGQVPEAVLDALWSQVIRQRDKVCKVQLAYGARMGLCRGDIQSAHLYSRTYRQIRWDELNGMGLCAAHHFFAHRNPVEAGRLYEAVRGRKELDTLWIKAQAVAKVDRHAVKARLMARIKELEERS